MTPALYGTIIIMTITIYSNDVNKTRHSVQLLAITDYSTLLCHKEVKDVLRIKKTAGLETEAAIGRSAIYRTDQSRL